MRLEDWRKAFGNPVSPSGRKFGCIAPTLFLLCSIRLRDIGTSKSEERRINAFRWKCLEPTTRRPVIRFHPQRGDSVSDRRPASLCPPSSRRDVSPSSDILFGCLTVLMFVAYWLRECWSNVWKRPRVGQGHHGWELCLQIWTPLTSHWRRPLLFHWA